MSHSTLRSSAPFSLRLAGQFLISLGFLLAGSAAQAGEPKADPDFELTLVRTGFPHDSMFDLAFQGQNGIAVGDHGVLLESRDGGKTWIEDEALGVDAALLSVTMNGERALVVGQEGIVLTRHGTQSWKRRESGSTERLLNVAMAKNGLAIAVGGFGTLLRSGDFGQSWEQLWPSWEEFLDDPGYEPHLYDVEILVDGRILLAGEFGLILLSRDSGETWEQRNASDESIFGMTILENGAGLAVGQNGYVIRTGDGGENWTVVDIPSEANLLDAWLSESGAAVVTGIRAMLASEDGGHSWAASAAPEIVRNWYAALAASQAPSPDEGEDDKPPVFMAGMLGMIMQVKLE